MQHGTAAGHDHHDVERGEANVKNIISASVAVIATGSMFACVAPFASADSAQTSAVVSSRSFPEDEFGEEESVRRSHLHFG